MISATSSPRISQPTSKSVTDDLHVAKSIGNFYVPWPLAACDTTGCSSLKHFLSLASRIPLLARLHGCLFSVSFMDFSFPDLSPQGSVLDQILHLSTLLGDLIKSHDFISHHCLLCFASAMLVASLFLNTLNAFLSLRDLAWAVPSA